MLSILMPVYNERERVERAIAEVLATELPTEFELIVVNDGSTDGTTDILRGLIQTHPTGRVRLIDHEVNRGHARLFEHRAAYIDGNVAYFARAAEQRLQQQTGFDGAAAAQFDDRHILRKTGGNFRSMCT